MRRMFGRTSIPALLCVFLCPTEALAETQRRPFEPHEANGWTVQLNQRNGDSACTASVVADDAMLIPIRDGLYKSVMVSLANMAWKLEPSKFYDLLLKIDGRSLTPTRALASTAYLLLNGQSEDFLGQLEQAGELHTEVAGMALVGQMVRQGFGRKDAVAAVA